MIGNNPVETLNDDRHVTAAGATENAHRHQRHGFGDAVRRATNRSGHMRAVPVTIIGSVAIENSVEARCNAPRELIVSCTNPGVDDV